jgi:hypothetical protein
MHIVLGILFLYSIVTWEAPFNSNKLNREKQNFYVIIYERERKNESEKQKERKAPAGQAPACQKPGPPQSTHTLQEKRG